jgi:hypothetical protein
VNTRFSDKDSVSIWTVIIDTMMMDEAGSTNKFVIHVADYATTKPRRLLIKTCANIFFFQAVQNCGMRNMDVPNTNVISLYLYTRINIFLLILKNNISQGRPNNVLLNNKSKSYVRYRLSFQSWYLFILCTRFRFILYVQWSMYWYLFVKTHSVKLQALANTVKDFWVP